MDPAVLLLLFSSRIYHSGRCFLLCSHSLFFFQEKLITIRTGKCHFSSVRDTRNNFNYYDKNNLNLNAYSVRNGTDQILLESPALLRLTESDEQTGRKSQSITRGTWRTAIPIICTLQRRGSVLYFPEPTHILPCTHTHRCTQRPAHTLSHLLKWFMNSGIGNWWLVAAPMSSKDPPFPYSQLCTHTHTPAQTIHIRPHVIHFHLQNLHPAP